MLQITPGECAALQLLADGKGTGEIALRLCVPESKIHQYLTTLFEKMGAATRLQAVAAARKRGLVIVDTSPEVGARIEGISESGESTVC